MGENLPSILGKGFYEVFSGISEQIFSGSLPLRPFNAFTNGQFHFRSGAHEKILLKRRRTNRGDWEFVKRWKDCPNCTDDLYRHLHIEELQQYPPKNFYVCNHSLFYKTPAE